ncbi:tRNA threonylcarbamoyladenosine biosynthesis protein TsaE [Dethiosulfatibacter aminovorans DSM 17477]|uniref:tRNA threonylcarbamoyladenosine biosynthesis protein TsaE n=1 Tax=Dethiosulfatibacter aminovorans DSM 17477 TaxID=1121476 RepID=A0A1M6D1G0_9FIRM|nr:tRNA (adenosine(37)-N6)-threonylcarbamoyltransferase complex ATPase subunit type 1 TsaE [Dethiosulfatibacter aminovorans]SHI67039.1 tRNA threonylcarbamoyladenosine biosynthesis protein TsaE [Dethiosulfatibacter aminovorans DSM 17477]
MIELLIKNLDDMETLAKSITNCYRPGMVICLDGDLGAGKTTLTQFIGKHLNIEDYITSPTFSIIKEYTENMEFYHMDAYRLENSDDAYDLDIDRYIYSNGLFVIEWSERIRDILPDYSIYINISFNAEDSMRKLSIEGKGKYYECLLGELENNENFRN